MSRPMKLFAIVPCRPLIRLRWVGESGITDPWPKSYEESRIFPRRTRGQPPRCNAGPSSLHKGYNPRLQRWRTVNNAREGVRRSHPCLHFRRDFLAPCVGGGDRRLRDETKREHAGPAAVLHIDVLVDRVTATHLDRGFRQRERDDGGGCELLSG